VHVDVQNASVRPQLPAPAQPGTAGGGYPGGDGQTPPQGGDIPSAPDPSAGNFALAERINNLVGTYNTPLMRSRPGAQFVASGGRWAIAPAFLVGIAAAESTLGRDASAQAAFNPFGMLSGPGRLIRYASYAHAIEATAKNLRQNSAYAGKTTVRSVYDQTYCVGTCHPETIEYIMVKLGFSPNMRVR
jgi:hypothetical protein